MKTSIVAALSMLLAGQARAQAPAGAETAQPSSAAPDQQPPPPPADLPAVPQDDAQTVAPQQASASGQWVYTDQYGWVWIPYGAQYTSEGATGDEQPYEYVYYPVSG